MQQPPQTPDADTVQTMDTTTRGNKGYGLNQGGFNAYSGFRGKHRYRRTAIKDPEPEVKPNNTLEDDKKQEGEKAEEKADPETTKY